MLIYDLYLDLDEYLSFTLSDISKVSVYWLLFRLRSCIYVTFMSENLLSYQLQNILQSIAEITYLLFENWKVGPLMESVAAKQ